MLPRFQLLCCLTCWVVPLLCAAQSEVLPSVHDVKAVLEVNPKDAQACGYLTFSGTKSSDTHGNAMQFFWGFGPTTPVGLRTFDMARLLEAATKGNSKVMQISPPILSAAASRVGPVLDQGQTRLEVRLTVRNALGNSSETMASAGIVGSTFQAEPVVEVDGPKVLKPRFSDPIKLTVHTAEAPFALLCARRAPDMSAGIVKVKWLHRELGAGQFTEIPQATVDVTGLQDMDGLPNVLHLEAFVFKPTTLHQIRVLAAYDMTDSLAPRSFVDFFLQVQDWPDIHVSILGPSVAYTGCAILLSADKSYDPAVGPLSDAIAAGTTGLEFNWSCIPVAQVGAKNYCEELGNFKEQNRAKTDGSGASGVTLRIPANVLPKGTYLFSVSVTRSSGHGTPMIANHGVSVEDGAFTPLTMVHVSYTYTGKLSVEAGLPDFAAFMPKNNHLGPGCLAPELHWRWALVLDGPRPSLQYILRTEKNTLSDSTVYIHSGFGPAASTAFQANNVSLLSGRTYYMILLQSSSKEQLDHLAQTVNASNTPILALLLLAQTQIVVAVTAPKFISDWAPWSGQTEISPDYVGAAIRTTFKIKTYLWQDEEPASLRYAFYTFPAPEPSTQEADMNAFILQLAKVAFFDFDVDGDDYITQVDLTVLEQLGNSGLDDPMCLDPKDKASCIAVDSVKVEMFKYDADSDGVISFDEFLQCLLATESARIAELEKGIVKVDPNALPVIDWDDPTSENYWLEVGGRLVRTWSFDNEVTIYSPPGRYFAVVRVMDSFGSITTAKAPKHLVALPVANLSQEEVDATLAMVDASNDPNEVLEACDALVAAARPNLRYTPCTAVELAENVCLGIFGSGVAGRVLRSLYSILSYIKPEEEQVLKLNLLVRELVDAAIHEMNITVDATAIFGESTRNLSNVTNETDVSADPHHTIIHVVALEITPQIPLDVLSVLERGQQYLLQAQVPPSQRSATSVLGSVAGIVGGLQYSGLESNAHLAVMQKVQSLLELCMLSGMLGLGIGENQELGVRLLPDFGANVSLAKFAVDGRPVTLPTLRVPGQVANQGRLQGTSCPSLEVMQTHWLGLNVNSWAPLGYGVTDLLLPNTSIMELALSRCGQPLRLKGLTNKLEIVLPLSPPLYINPGFFVTYMCAFFDDGLGAWSTAGMAVQGTVTNRSTELTCLSDRSSGYFAAVYKVQEVIPVIVNATVQAPREADSGLSTGVLAGIISGSICVACCCCIGGILLGKKLSRVKPIEETPPTSEEEVEQKQIWEVVEEKPDPNPELTRLKLAAESGKITARELLAFHAEANGSLHPELIFALDRYQQKCRKMKVLVKKHYINSDNPLEGRLEGMLGGNVEGGIEGRLDGLTPAANEELGHSPAQPPAVKVRAKVRSKAKVKLRDPTAFPGSRNPDFESDGNRGQPKARSRSPTRR
eukprot:TRINITY_DN26612_c0_g1_i1.p1 TRINITY_DN26612_c0_g1~~TRINITY_DN26612_c0_g1_i1.p1  ORF type:complete len:1425 (+),score=223.80 TRINITY_DN26612_c0_g1_i1:162-4436(+)